MAIPMRSPFKSYDRLKKSGMTEEQARGIVEAIEESAEFSFKIEVSEIKTDIKAIKASIRSLQTMFMSGFLVIAVGMVLSFFHH